MQRMAPAAAELRAWRGRPFGACSSAQPEDDRRRAVNPATRRPAVRALACAMEETVGIIESVLQEGRIFTPSAETVANAAVSGMDAYQALMAEAEQDYEGFWAKLARETLAWNKPFTKVLD
ncbi:acetyl-coenzyme A synthetase N-terminal domain-containing protein, partial [Trinickia caryophylli]